MPPRDNTRMTASDYKSPAFDEFFAADGKPHSHTKRLHATFANWSAQEFAARQKACQSTIREMGISFTLYSEGNAIDRDWLYDMLPRVIPLKQWRKVERGLIQRAKALNMFISDIYNEQKILAQGIVPDDIVLSSPNYLEACRGVVPRHGAWANVCGIDLVRDETGFYVLEDNLRIPSGVSYALENRAITKRVLPEIFADHKVVPLVDYPIQLYRMLASLSPRKVRRPTIALLTPGIYNSAYFEHAFLAQEMGVWLVENDDMFVDSDTLYLRTISGPERVDVVYRRTDETFLDPQVFDPESILGVPGIMRAWRAGNVSIANAPGAGVADDKVIYAYVPEMIRFYLGEEPAIANVETYLCSREKDRDYVLANLDKLVVKHATGSGGYGMLIGPAASPEERGKFAELIQRSPRSYIAQPTLNLSTCPVIGTGDFEPRHIDLRPFILCGAQTYVTPGGLTRVASKPGSLVVNSSQGGSSKDTWIAG